MNAQLIAGAVVSCLGLACIGAAIYLSWRNGNLTAEKEYAERDLEAARRVSDSEARGPDDRADLDQRLRNGGGL